MAVNYYIIVRIKLWLNNLQKFVISIHYTLLVMFVKIVSKSILTLFELRYPLNNQPVKLSEIFLMNKEKYTRAGFEPATFGMTRAGYTN